MNKIKASINTYSLIVVIVVSLLLLNVAIFSQTAAGVLAEMDVEIVAPSQDESMRLKKDCRPLGMFEVSGSKNLRHYAKSMGGDTVQLFHEEKGFLGTFGSYSEIRLWQCSGKNNKMQFSSFKNKKSKKSKNGLARLLILDFFDNTNSKLYGWLSGSLVSAIDDAMHSKFEYIRPSPEMNQKRASTILKGAKKPTKEQIIQIGKKLKVDIVIFGEYVFNKRTNKITIKSRILYVSDKKIIGKVEENTSIDSSLFQSTTIISNIIVQKIFKYETMY